MIVLDTHVLVRWRWDSKRLSRRAAAAIRAALQDGPLAVSAASVFEIATAARRRRLVFSAPVDDVLNDLRLLPELHCEPVSYEIAHSAGSLAEAAPGDSIDRLIAATALTLGTPLLKADRALAKIPGLEIVW